MSTPVEARTSAARKLATTEMKEPVTLCTHCGSPVETKYSFCWKCGKPMRSKNESSGMYSEKFQVISPSAAIAPDDEDLTLVREAPLGAPQMFSWAVAKDPEAPRASQGSVLKLIAVAVVALALLSLGLFALTRSFSSMGSVTAAQAVPTNMQSDADVAPGRDVTRDAATEPKPQPPAAAPPADDELNTLREKRIAATASDRSAIFQAFAKAEKQYPNDYRFPYERAKLAINEFQSSFHDQAFNALSLAAERAISIGKAHEMLDRLEADKADDFHKLSHGHSEWNQLRKALTSQNTRLLSAKAQF